MTGLDESEKPLCGAVEPITRKEAVVDREPRRVLDEVRRKTTSRTMMTFTRMTIPTIRTTTIEISIGAVRLGYCMSKSL